MQQEKIDTFSIQRSSQIKPPTEPGNVPGGKDINMNTWNRLDLRNKDQRPKVDALVALHFSPNNARATFYQNEDYQIGHFILDRNGKKLWWQHSRGTSDPTRLKHHYDIWWRYVEPFDGI